MFIANARRPFAVLDGMSFRNHAPIIGRSMACLVVGVGAYGQVHDSLVPPASPWSDLHVGFGTLLLCAVCVRMRALTEVCAVGRGIDMYATTRQLARLVYLLLYALAGLRELTNIIAYLWHGGSFDLGWIQVGHRSVGPPPKLPTIDSFQIYLSYGIVAICMIRVGARASRRVS